MSRRLIPASLFFASACFTATAYGQAPQPQISAEQMIFNAKKLVAVDADGCLQNTNENEIVVCGSYDADRQYRLPLPTQLEGGERIREPLPLGDSDYVNTGRCHIDASERKCFKGLNIFSTGFGGGNGSAAPLWQVIKSEVPDEVFVKQVQIPEASTPE